MNTQDLTHEDFEEDDRDYVMPQVTVALSAIPTIKIDALDIDESMYMQGYRCAEFGGETLSEAPHPLSRVVPEACYRAQQEPHLFESWLLGWTHYHIVRQQQTGGEG
ncbi:MAG: hypothetical protein FD176_165 [Rhodospirillaceae bacterium]|nr:MAG: hypothetical protein FD176_165 [Rhodospirillaceae bacterium]TNC98683.1 MAG: hypothetical protein FD119_154 [Stygiobacter sp.]